MAPQTLKYTLQMPWTWGSHFSQNWLSTTKTGTVGDVNCLPAF